MADVKRVKKTISLTACAICTEPHFIAKGYDDGTVKIRSAYKTVECDKPIYCGRVKALVINKAETYVMYENCIVVYDSKGDCVSIGTTSNKFTAFNVVEWQSNTTLLFAGCDNGEIHIWMREYDTWANETNVDLHYEDTPVFGFFPTENYEVVVFYESGKTYTYT